MALKDSVLTNIPSVMNFGLLLGAMLAAGLANRFNEASRNRPEGRQFLASVVPAAKLRRGLKHGTCLYIVVPESWSRWRSFWR